jgi:hypothetical protein
MSTISNAVQAIVDNLVAKMASNTPLAPEEQSMVAEAIALLSKSTTLEAALIAVAEKHLDTATTALDSAKASLQENADYLKLLPQINEIKTSFSKIKTGLDNTLGDLPAVMREGAPAVPDIDISYVGPDILAINTVSIQRIDEEINFTVIRNETPSTVVSLFDDGEKCFYLYLGYGGEQTYPNYDTALKIDATGIVSLSQPESYATRISSSGEASFLLIKTKQGVRLAKFTEESLNFFDVMPSISEASGTIPLSDGIVYQDPDSLDFCSYSRGRVQHVVWDEKSSSFQVNPDNEHEFLVAANFNEWAEQQGYIKFSQEMGGAGNEGYASLNAGSSTGLSLGRNINQTKTMTYRAGKYFINKLGDTYVRDITSESNGWGLENNLSSFYYDQTSGCYLSVQGQGRLTGTGNNSYIASFHPAVLAMSPYHRVAVLAMAAGYYRTESYTLGSTKRYKFTQSSKTVLRAF